MKIDSIFKKYYDIVSNEMFMNHLVNDLVVRVWNQEVYSLVISSSSFEVANIDGHWRLTWLLTLRPIKISRDK